MTITLHYSFDTTCFILFLFLSIYVYLFIQIYCIDITIDDHQSIITKPTNIQSPQINIHLLSIIQIQTNELFSSFNLLSFHDKYITYYKILMLMLSSPACFTSSYVIPVCLSSVFIYIGHPIISITTRDATINYYYLIRTVTNIIRLGP